LLLNVYWFWVLGTPIEKVFGTGKWVLFLLTAGAVSSAAQLAHTDSTGIGASGVAYAFFGLIWFGRKRYPGLNGVLDRKLIFIFLFWLLICSFNPDIGNAAHLAGLFFGSAIGAALIYPGIRSRMAWAFCVTLLTATFLILLWCPWSSDWNAAKAYNAHSSGDFSTAIRYYRKTIDIDDSSYNAAWAWNNLADISEFNGDVKAAEHARQMALKLENMNPGSSD
jgi:GlpG protein